MPASPVSSVTWPWRRPPPRRSSTPSQPERRRLVDGWMGEIEGSQRRFLGGTGVRGGRHRGVEARRATSRAARRGISDDARRVPVGRKFRRLSWFSIAGPSRICAWKGGVRRFQTWGCAEGPRASRRWTHLRRHLLVQLLETLLGHIAVFPGLQQQMQQLVLRPSPRHGECQWAPAEGANTSW